MDGLVSWLKQQHKGLQTYQTFQQKVLDAGSKHRDDYALYYLLATLVGRFVSIYEETPLTLSIADEAHRRLVALSEKAARYPSLSSDDKIKLLNDIAASDLS